MPEEQPVKGNEAVRRMAERALNQPRSSSKADEEDPIEAARKTKRQLMADEMIGTEIAESRAKTAKAEAEAKEAEARARRAEAGAEQGNGGPFKVTGAMNLGNIDLQKEREENKERLEKLKQEADDAAKATGNENVQLREEIHKLEIEKLQLSLQAQIETLTKAIAASTSKKGFMEQYTEAMETAKTLGFQLGTPQPGTEQIQIELKKLEFEQTLALKKLAREDRAEQRKWDIELRRLDDERKAKEAELAGAQRRDDMIAGAPQMIGAAMAKGIMESKGGGGGGGEVTRGPRGKPHHIEVGLGESGETLCPECGEVMGIGPTARAAVCPGCGLKVPIKRVSKEAEEEQSGERSREVE